MDCSLPGSSEDGPKGDVKMWERSPGKDMNMDKCPEIESSLAGSILSKKSSLALL